MTDPAEFERRTEQLRLDRARRKVPGMYQQAAARTQRLLGHPPDRATPTCGHPGDPQFVDYLRGEDLRVVCLRCLLDRLAQPGHRSFDPRLHTCWSCGDDELVAEISAVVHVEGWDCVEHLLTAPLGFSCPACDGFEGKLPPIVIKRWGPDAAPRWAPAGDGPEPDAARCRRRGGLSCQLPKIMSTRWAELPADLQG